MEAIQSPEKKPQSPTLATEAEERQRVSASGGGQSKQMSLSMLARIWATVPEGHSAALPTSVHRTFEATVRTSAFWIVFSRYKCRQLTISMNVQSVPHPSTNSQVQNLPAWPNQGHNHAGSELGRNDIHLYGNPNINPYNQTANIPAQQRTVNVRAQAGRTENQRRPQPFLPSAMANPHTQARRENPTPEEVARRVAAGVSPNYRGSYHVARNLSANIPEEENCSVWITRLPGDLTTNQLLAAIRNTGRVFASAIQPSVFHDGTAAAKVTFFAAESAQKFLKAANEHPGFWVGGRWALVRPDRIRIREVVRPAEHSRVLRIAGPSALVAEEVLHERFSRNFVYQIDEVIPLILGEGIDVYEWRFGSYRCQAQWAWRMIREDSLFQAQGVRVRFERDPCDV